MVASSSIIDRVAQDRWEVGGFALEEVFWLQWRVVAAADPGG
jgi:hypothetical protein